MTKSAQSEFLSQNRASFHASWRDNAACLNTDVETFFTDELQQFAKRICWSCESIAECREWAFDAGENHGVWGGLSAGERRKIVIAWRKRRKTDPRTTLSDYSRCAESQYALTC